MGFNEYSRINDDDKEPNGISKPKGTKNLSGNDHYDESNDNKLKALNDLLKNKNSDLFKLQDEDEVEEFMKKF